MVYVVWSCLVCCGVGRCGVVWCGVVWCGVVWCGVVWCGVVWCGVVCVCVCVGLCVFVEGCPLEPFVQWFIVSLKVSNEPFHFFLVQVSNFQGRVKGATLYSTVYIYCTVL
jgi:hypothetical protein